jgi:Sulfotransferase family
MPLASVWRRVPRLKLRRHASSFVVAPPGYCFIVGCPRSGTTEVTRLLHAQPELVLGMERYRRMLYQLDERGQLAEFGAGMFQPQRFLNFELDDDRFRDHYRTAALRFAAGPVKYVGDKVPHTTSIVLALTQNFPNAMFVFIYRDLERVANSYCRRARDPNDPWPREATCEVAIHHWQEAFASADAVTAAIGDDRMFVVKYEQLFGGDRRVVEKMFAWLGVDPRIGALPTFKRQMADRQRVRTRALVLTEAERQFVGAKRDRGALDRYDARAAAELRTSGISPAQTARGKHSR